MAKILAIDDEQQNLTVMSGLLERLIPSTTVYTARSGQEGIRKAKEMLPDTILLDLHMPDMDGFEVCRRLKTDKGTGRIPIIMITGVGIEVQSRVKGLEIGADAYLTKPFESSELTAQIKAIWRIKKAEEELRQEKRLQESLIQERTEALEERKRAFFTLTDNLPGMAYRCCNDEKRTMEFVSKGCVDLIEYSADEVIENRAIAYGELIHHKDRKIVLKQVQSAVAEESPFTITYRIKTAGGSEKWVWEQGRGVGSSRDGLVAIEGFVIDISERKQLEDRLVRREGWLTQTIQGSPIATFVINRDHVITHWNKGCEQMTGYPASDMIGRTAQWKPFYSEKRPVLADLIVDTDFKRFHELYGDKRAGKSKVVASAWEVTDFFQELGGKPRHVFFMAAPIRDIKGNVIGAIETLQDISRHKEFEHQLLQSEQRYRILTEQVADGVAVIQNRRLVFVNDPLVSMFGDASAERLLRRRIRDFVCPESRSAISELNRELEMGNVASGVLRLKCCGADNAEFWIEMHNRFIDWQGNGAILATIRDITETKRQEAELKRESSELRDENIRLKSSIKDRYKFRNIVGKSPVMQRLYEQILEASATNAHVIVYGESGTGKELVARAIHDLSDRHGGEFVTVNCGAIPENLLESEFFGHKKGAFTGAHCDKHGYLDSADGGSLFLDEVGELGLNMQVKLLRAIEGGGYAPVGGAAVRNSDFRIIAATNRDLKDLLNKGRIREDFFYRIHVVPITLPPLRQRREDIPLLVDHFHALHSEDTELSPLPAHVMDALKNYHWPGNVRELQNVVNRYVTVGNLSFFQIEMKKAACSLSADNKKETCDELVNLREAVDAFEKEHIIKTLTQTQWNRGKAAARLGISRKTLFRKMRTFGSSAS